LTRRFLRRWSVRTGGAVIAALVLVGCSTLQMPEMPEFLNFLPFAGRSEAVSAKHFAIVAYPEAGSRSAAAQRIASLLRDRLAEQGGQVTLLEGVASRDLKYGTPELQLFESLLEAPAANQPWPRYRQSMEPYGGELVVACRLDEYGQRWHKDERVKRIVVQCACGDVLEATRLARFQVTAERSGWKYTFDDVEEQAARMIFDRLGKAVRAQEEAARQAAEAAAAQISDASPGDEAAAAPLHPTPSAQSAAPSPIPTPVEPQGTPEGRP